jgi:hypothetical protein
LCLVLPEIHLFSTAQGALSPLSSGKTSFSGKSEGPGIRGLSLYKEVFFLYHISIYRCVWRFFAHHSRYPSVDAEHTNYMDVSLVNPLTANTLLLIWAAYLGYRLRRDRVPMARSIVLRLLGSIGLELGLSASSHFWQACWWMQALEILCLHYGLLLIYVASDQLLNNKPYLPLMRHRLPVLIAISIGAVLGALSGYHLELFLVDPAFKPTPLYMVSYLWNYGLQLCCIVFMLRLYWGSLHQHTALTYLIRRLTCILSFFIAACSLLASGGSLLLPLLGQRDLRLPLAQIVPIGETLVIWLLVASFTIPQDVMERIVQPVADSLAWRQWLQHDLLYSLHEKMIQVVPCVHLAYQEMQDMRVLIEISDARQIIWSHIPPTRAITVQEEAQYLLSLLQQNIVITAPGIYQPLATHQSNVIKHNLAVAKRLKYYARQGHIRATSALDTLPLRAKIALKS